VPDLGAELRIDWDSVPVAQFSLRLGHNLLDASLRLFEKGQRRYRNRGILRDELGRQKKEKEKTNKKYFSPTIALDKQTPGQMTR
jgi:hypothetical protein